MGEQQTECLWALPSVALEAMKPAERRRVRIVAAIEPEIRRYLKVAINDPEERADAIADSLARAFDAVTSDSTIESIRVLALAVARECSNKWKQRQRRILRQVVDELAGVVGGRDKDLVRQRRLELWDRLKPTLDHLRDEERIAFELYVADERADEEIAAVLQSSTASVRKWRERAKRVLRRLLERESDGLTHR